QQTDTGTPGLAANGRATARTAKEPTNTEENRPNANTNSNQINPISPADARGHRRRVIRQLSRAKKTNKSSDETITMSTQSPRTSKSPSQSSVGMFSAGEARCDRWQELAHAAQTLVAQSSAGSSTRETLAAV